MLEKPEFDCTNLGSFYDCGCAEEPGEGKEGEGAKAQDSGKSSVDSKDHPAVEISKEASV